MSALQKLARMLGVGEHQAEDAMHSERAAKAALSRRNLFAAAGALAAGTVFVSVQPVAPVWQTFRIFIKGDEFYVVDGFGDLASAAVVWKRDSETVAIHHEGGR